ncbi:hypothetical protein F5B17DRAFT_404067 [Nemania serpens]|nr:hypothetical protein F5B17DRAFT_404067 [Nemania serpens]
MDDDTDSSPEPARPTRHLPSRQAKLKTKTPARQTRSTTAYFTSSSNTQTSPSSLSSSSTETDSRPLTRNARLVREKRKPTTAPAKPTKRQRVQPPAERTPLRLAHRRHTPSNNAVDEVPPGHGAAYPPWHTLYYHIWLRVFDLVAAPVRDPASRIDDLVEAVGTLISGARACKATAEPALAALYRCPPFHRPYKSQGAFAQFLHTLALPPGETFIRYRPKVEVLRIETESLLSKKVNGVQLQLKHVLKDIPRLTSLELYHAADDPPYRDLDSNLRYRFSKDDLLDGLRSLPQGDASSSDKTAAITLKSWRWNSRLSPTELNLDRLCDIHALPSFQSLRKLAYVNYQLPSTTQFSARTRESPAAQKSDLQAIAHLAASISALPNLEHLVIESSTLANGSLLERLPKTLTHLELVNCWEITSNDMSKFLMSHGNSLVYLTLKHCQSLSLGFLPVLGTSCPNLAHLEVDLSYFRHHESYADNKPEYETLLEVDEVPTWPSSIQSIEIINMRNWTREAAEMFFDSLMNNARELSNLRRLEFKVILNIEWRQRQEMRKSLADQMTKVFKRKSSPPKERKSLRPSGETKSKTVDELDTPKVPVRRSTRITHQSSTSVSNKTNKTPSGKRDGSKALPVRKSMRSLEPISSTFDADDEDSSEDELSLAHGGTRRGRNKATTVKAAGLQGEEFIHGLCDVVDIQVDNQRPAERQYEMDDFLDAPDRSETEWDSEEDDVFG